MKETKTKMTEQASEGEAVPKTRQNKEQELFEREEKVLQRKQELKGEES